MNKVRSSPREYASAVEREIAHALERTLTAPWKLQSRIESLEVPSVGSGWRYTPDFVIRNESTGETLSVEVKSSLSLSMPNLIKLHEIQSAVESDGSKFLLLVHANTGDTAKPSSMTGEYGVNAVTVSGASEAAHVIEEHLSAQQ